MMHDQEAYWLSSPDQKAKNFNDWWVHEEWQDRYMRNDEIESVIELFDEMPDKSAIVQLVVASQFEVFF